MISNTGLTFNFAIPAVLGIRPLQACLHSLLSARGKQIGNANDRIAISYSSELSEREVFRVRHKLAIYFALIASHVEIRARAVFCTIIYAQHQIQRLAFCTNSCYNIRLHISIFGLCWYLQGCESGCAAPASLSDARANNRRCIFEFYDSDHRTN